MTFGEILVFFVVVGYEHTDEHVQRRLASTRGGRRGIVVGDLIFPISWVTAKRENSAEGRERRGEDDVGYNYRTVVCLRG